MIKIVIDCSIPHPDTVREKLHPKTLDEVIAANKEIAAAEEAWAGREQVIEISPEEAGELIARDKPIEELIRSASDNEISKIWPNDGALALDMVTRGKEIVEAEMAQIRQDVSEKVVEIETAALEASK